MVVFRRLNLINNTYPFKGLFDIIFCRNVMIYFDEVTRQGLVERFYNFTKNEGHLFIGHSESLNRSNTLYSYIKPAIYQKK
jgi:chemotaxis protein methyltransferase CheR